MVKLSWNLIKEFMQGITIEPAWLLFMLAHGFYSIVAQNLYIDKVCRVNLNFTTEICDNIQQYEDQQIEVQKYTAALQSYNSILQAVPGVVYSLFAGPWSDANGRKMLMVCATFGYVFNNAVFMINSYFFYELKAEYLLFECLQDFTGGSTLFFLAAYSYIADVTSAENRTQRIAFLDGLWPIGYFFGMYLAGQIKTNLGYMYNYSLGMLTSVLAMAYILIVVKDSRKLRAVRLAKEKAEALEKEATKMETAEKEALHQPTEKELADQNEEEQLPKGKVGCKALFDLTNVLDGIKTVIKKRDNHKRTLLLLTILVFELEIFIIVGKWANTYLFFRRSLKWTIVEYSRYTTTFGMVGVGAQYLLMPLMSKYLRWSDTTILIVTTLGCIVNHFVIAFATYEWQLYIGMLFSATAFCATTLCRSMISKFVAPHEVGKVFAIVGAIQALMPFAAGPTFGFLYRATVAKNPAAFIYMVIGMYFFLLAVICLVHFWSKKQKREQKLSPVK